MFRHYSVILREFVVSTLPSYRSMANAAVGNTIYNLKLFHKLVYAVGILKFKISKILKLSYL